MKKNWLTTIEFILVIGIFLFVSTGCDNSLREFGTGDNIIKQKANEKDVNYEKSFGSYQISSEWKEVENNNSRYRYVKRSEVGNYNANNISIQQLENNYSIENHVEFKNSILKGLSSQNLKGITVNSSGSTTENGDILYTFILSGDKGVTTEYCIIGDYKYILITEVNIDGSEETDSVAKKIVDSFKWKE